MSKVLIYVSGGNIQWTAGDPDLQITIVDADNESVSTGEPDTCVPEHEEFDDYLDDDTKAEIERYGLSAKMKKVLIGITYQRHLTGFYPSIMC